MMMKINIPKQLVVDDDNDSNYTTMSTTISSSRSYISPPSIITCQPSVVEFTKPNKPTSLTITNVCSTRMYFQIEPLKSPFITLTMVKKASLAPGVSQHMTLTCTSPIDFVEEVRIHTNHGIVHVKLRGYVNFKKSVEMEFVKSIDMGNVVVGEELTKIVHLYNKTRYDVPYEIIIVSDSNVSDFTLSPKIGLAPSMSSINITVTYRPSRRITTHADIRIVFPTKKLFSSLTCYITGSAMTLKPLEPQPIIPLLPISKKKRFSLVDSFIPLSPHTKHNRKYNVTPQDTRRLSVAYASTLTPNIDEHRFSVIKSMHNNNINDDRRLSIAVANALTPRRSSHISATSSVDSNDGRRLRRRKSSIMTEHVFTPRLVHDVLSNTIDVNDLSTVRDAHLRDHSDNIDISEWDYSEYADKGYDTKNLEVFYKRCTAYERHEKLLAANPCKLRIGQVALSSSQLTRLKHAKNRQFKDLRTSFVRSIPDEHECVLKRSTITSLPLHHRTNVVFKTNEFSWNKRRHIIQQWHKCINTVIRKNRLLKRLQLLTNRETKCIDKNLANRLNPSTIANHVVEVAPNIEIDKSLVKVDKVVLYPVITNTILAMKTPSQQHLMSYEPFSNISTCSIADIGPVYDDDDDDEINENGENDSKKDDNDNEKDIEKVDKVIISTMHMNPIDNSGKQTHLLDLECCEYDDEYAFENILVDTTTFVTHTPILSTKQSALYEDLEDRNNNVSMVVNFFKYLDNDNNNNSNGGTRGRTHVLEKQPLEDNDDDDDDSCAILMKAPTLEDVTNVFKLDYSNNMINNLGKTYHEKARQAFAKRMKQHVINADISKDLEKMNDFLHDKELIARALMK